MDHSKFRILIVDDDKDIVEVIKTILELESFKVSCANSGKELSQELKKELPDLLLIDYMLPDTNGKKIAEQLRADKETSTLPLILISAATEAKEKYESLPFDDFIEKPFDIDTLLSKIKRLLKQ